MGIGQAILIMAAAIFVAGGLGIFIALKVCKGFLAQAVVAMLVATALLYGACPTCKAFDILYARFGWFGTPLTKEGRP